MHAENPEDGSDYGSVIRVVGVNQVSKGSAGVIR